MPRQLTIQIKLKPNCHIIPDTQIYFICIKSQVVRIKMIKKIGMQFRAYIYVIRMRNDSKEKLNYNL